MPSQTHSPLEAWKQEDRLHSAHIPSGLKNNACHQQGENNCKFEQFLQKPARFRQTEHMLRRFCAVRQCFCGMLEKWEFCFADSTIFYPDNTEEIHWLLKKIYQEYLNRQSDHEQMLHCYINQLLILISRIQQQTIIPGEQPASVFPELLSIREQMLRDCEKPWTVDELIQARLQKACFLLTNDAITIREAAFESGFQNINHFNRIFRKVYGCAPGEYRSQKKVGR